VARISGVGSGYHLTKQLPGTFIVVRRAGDVWRHLVDSQISGHPSTATFTPRLQLQALDRSPIATAAETAPTWRRSSPKTNSPKHILPAQDFLGELVERSQTLDHRTVKLDGGAADFTAIS